MRYEYIWGICTGEVENLLQDEKSPAPGQEVSERSGEGGR